MEDLLDSQIAVEVKVLKSNTALCNLPKEKLQMVSEVEISNGTVDPVRMNLLALL